MMKRLVTLLFLLTLGGLAAAQEGEPVTIGVNLELSGRMVSLGTPELQGAQAALELHRASGLPVEVELSICDNQTTPEGSIACANQFIDEGAVAVIGTGGSSQAIPAAEVLQDAGIVMVTPSSTNNATTQIGDYIFRVAYNDEFQGQVAAEYAYNQADAQRVAIVRQQDDDYSFGLAGYFDDTFTSLGGETTTVDIVANQVDFAAQINDIRQFQPDLIYAPIFCAEAVPLVQQLRQQGFADTQLVGADGSDDPQCPEGGGQAFDGWVYTGFAGPDQLTGAAADRAADFREFFTQEFPDGIFNGFTLAGADSLNVIVEAITNAEDPRDPAAVRDALANLEDFPGVSGNITYAGTDGTPADRIMGFFEYSGGEYPGQPLFDAATGSEEGN